MSQVLAGLTVLGVAFGILLLVGLAVGRGFAGLTDHGTTASAREVGSDVLVLAVLSGVLAAAVTEFLKRVMRLRERFNRTAARNFLGDLAEFDWNVKAPDGVPFFAVPPTYGAPLSQLCAQLGQTLAMLAQGVAEDRVGKHHRDLTLQVLFDHPEAVLKVREALDAQSSQNSSPAPRSEWSEPAAQSATTSTLLLAAERQLDAFQLRTRAQWHRMLQWISAGTAAGFMLCVGLAVQAATVPVLVGSLLGLVIGGPVSWTVRDIARLIERRSARL